MVNESKDTMDLLHNSFQALEHPELVYRPSQEFQKAAYTSALGFLLSLVAIQFSAGSPSLLFVAILGFTIIIELFSLVFLVSGFLKSMMVEHERRLNGVIFANSVLAQQSDEAITNFRMFNIKVKRTHNPGPSLAYALLTIMGLFLFVIQLFVVSSGTVLTDNMEMLFGLTSGSPFSVVTFLALIITGTGVLGLGFRYFSDNGVKRWQSKSKAQILIDAEKLVSTYSKGITTTYEEAVKLLKDAENGYPDAIEQTHLMAEGMNKEIARFKKIRTFYILAIIFLSLIDVIIFLLP